MRSPRAKIASAASLFKRTTPTPSSTSSTPTQPSSRSSHTCGHGRLNESSSSAKRSGKPSNLRRNTLRASPYHHPERPTSAAVRGTTSWGPTRPPTATTPITTSPGAHEQPIKPPRAANEGAALHRSQPRITYRDTPRAPPPLLASRQPPCPNRPAPMMSDRQQETQQSWERAGQPWCSHQWVERYRDKNGPTDQLVCRSCGASWCLGAPAPAPQPRGTTVERVHGQPPSPTSR